MEACTGKHVILDLGANAMASAREIVDMVPALTAAFEAAGYESLAIFPLSSNKAGAAGSIKNLAQLLPAQNKLLVLNDADGSGNFEPIDLPIDIARLEQLHPGFIAYVDALDSKSFGEAVMAPAPDHILASHIIGKWMKDFGKDLPFQDVFGPAIAELSLLPEPKKNVVKVDRASQTCDRSLLKFVEKTHIIELLNEHGWDAAGLLKAHQILAKEESTAL